jgi:ribosomal protein S17E
MVEEDNCKDKLMAVVRKLEGMTSFEGITGELNYNGTARRFYSPEGYVLRLVFQGELDEVPEEVCCKVIEAYNKLTEGDFETPKILGYSITILKNHQNFEGDDLGTDVETMIRIRREDDLYSTYFIVINCYDDNLTSDFDKQWNKGLELCKKLTRENVVL